MVSGDMFARLGHGSGCRWTRGLKDTHKVDPPSPLPTFIPKFLGVFILRSDHLSVPVITCSSHPVPFYEPPPSLDSFIKRWLRAC